MFVFTPLKLGDKYTYIDNNISSPNSDVYLRLVKLLTDIDSLSNLPDKV